MYRWFFALLCFVPFALQSDPWGKDADLLANTCEVVTVRPSSPFTYIGVQLIKFHQEVISPCDGPRSHYKPSSSQYALEAMCKYGFFRGVLYGCDRLMRENSDIWVYPIIPGEYGPMKFDPVR